MEGRAKRIGGSEASSIVGMNPYQTNIDLWKIKTGRVDPVDISESPFVLYGANAEGPIRELFKMDFPQFHVDYVQNNMWLNDRLPFAHASLDGWMEDEQGRMGVLEIKTTNIQQSLQREKWDNRIPDNYYIQVLHYLMVTEFDFAVLKAQLKYDHGDGNILLTTRHYMIEREEVQEDIEYLEKSERDFFEHVKNDTMPPLVLPEI